MTDITKQKIIKRFLGIRHAYLLPIFHYKSFYHTSWVGSSPTHVQGGRSDLCLEGSIIMYASHLRSIKVRYDSALESKLHISVLMQY